MNINEALNLLAQVCAEYKGTLREHQAIQEAGKIVNDKCNAITKDNVVDKCNELQQSEEKDESPSETPEGK